MKIDYARLFFGFSSLIIVLLLELIPILIVYYSEVYSLILYVGVPITILGGLAVGILSFKEDLTNISIIICSVIAVILVVVFYRFLTVLIEDSLTNWYIQVFGFIIVLEYIAILILIFLVEYVALIVGVFGGKLIGNRIWDDKKKEEFHTILIKKLKKTKDLEKSADVTRIDTQ